MEDTTVLGTTPATLREHVAEEIYGWLGKRRMSVAELARRLGHANSMSLFRRLEGKIAWDVDELGKVAKILRIRVSDLLPDEAVAAAPPAKPLDLDQIIAISARLNRPVAELIDLLSEGSGETSPWYVHLGQIVSPPNGHPRDGRPPARPIHSEAVRRPQRRPALLPAAHMTVNNARLAG